MAIEILFVALTAVSAIMAEEPPSTTNTTCENFASCDTCVSEATCYWCNDISKCFHYDVTRPSTYFDHCGWADAKWRHCWLNVKALVIAGGVLGGLILIALVVACCICRRKCRQRTERKMAREEAELERQEEERKERSEAKKAERKARTDEVRQKYGLLKEDD